MSSAASVRERNAVQHYLEQLDRTDAQDELVIDSSAVRAALERLKSDPEPKHVSCALPMACCPPTTCRPQ